MTGDELLAELRRNVYVALRPSPVEGIGVFALRDIPAGCREMFSPPDLDDRWIPIGRDDIATLPAHSRQLVETYCLYDEHNYFVPDHGFKKMDLVCYLNHSDTPNVVSIDDGDFFQAIRDISAGEELLIDYGEIVADE